MFEIGWSEMLVVAVLALIFIGPKELPTILYQVGRWMRGARMLAREFQGHVDDLMRQAEIADLKQKAQAAHDLMTGDVRKMAADVGGWGSLMGTGADAGGAPLAGGTGRDPEPDPTGPEPPFPAPVYGPLPPPLAAGGATADSSVPGGMAGLSPPPSSLPPSFPRPSYAASEGHDAGDAVPTAPAAPAVPFGPPVPGGATSGLGSAAVRPWVQD